MRFSTVNENTLRKVILLVSFWAILYQSYAPVDLFGYVVFGEWMIENGSILTTDIYSFTMSGAEWINHEWLFHLLVGGLYKLSGWVGLQILLFVMVGGVVVMLGVFTFNGTNSLLSGTGHLILPLLALFPALALRPQVVTFLFLLLLIPIVLRENFSIVNGIVILIIFVLWANLHGGFIFGLAIWGALLPFQWYRTSFDNVLRQSLILLLCVLSTLINPFGLQLWKMIYTTITEPLTVTFIEEWQPTWSSTYHGLIWIGLTIQTIFQTQCNEEESTQSKFLRILPVILVAYLALWPKRNVAVYGLTVALISKPVDLDIWNIKFSERVHIPSSVIRGLFVGMVIGSIYLFWVEARDGLRTAGIDYPGEFVEIVRRAEGEKRVLVHYPWAEWWFFKDSSSKVFLDGRWTTVYSQEVIEDYLAAVLGNTQILKKHRVNWVALPNKYYLNVKLSNRPQKWKRVHTTANGTLWRRKEAYNN